MAAELTLQPVAVRGRAGGFRNLLRNELAAFWGTPTWLIQVGTWLVFGPGFLLLFLLSESLGAGQDGRAPRAAIELAARVLPATAGTLVAIAAVILAQGKIVGEKQSGTAAWVLSKPVSRGAFVLAKFLALGSGMVATAVGVQGAGAYAIAAAADGPAPLVPYLAALAALAVQVLFYLALALLLGTVFRSRNPVIAIPLLLLFVMAQWLGSVELSAVAGALSSKLPSHCAITNSSSSGMAITGLRERQTVPSSRASAR
ncbi:MAG TPA: ABC transporter permease subunit [Chloroflexota bacterium]|nr:ABC transporter permease subunit [Chloroflexota bacterium]